MQNVLAKGRLLDDQGKLLQAGYSTAYARTYRRDDIKASKWRIKEWDYYLVSDGERALAFTLSDIGYLALASISLVDLKEKNFVTKTGISPFPFGKHNFPSDFNKGDVGFECGNIAISMRNDGKARRIKAECKNFKDGKSFFAEITLSQPPRDAMVIATPFPGNDLAFYYNAKVNCMTASGYYEIGDEMTVLDATKSLGTLDWGRGVWPYSNTWYWSSMQHRTENGGTIGFNLGYGFGDTSQATENMFFVNGRAHKLNNVDRRLRHPRQGTQSRFDEAVALHRRRGTIGDDLHPCGQPPRRHQCRNNLHRAKSSVRALLRARRAGRRQQAAI